MQLDALSTPALLLDLQVLLRNLDAMAVRTRELGVQLRPHFKTHKCVEVAELQRRRGAAGATVSTLEEARALAAAGWEDLTWAVPLPLSRLGEALDLNRRLRLGLLLDSSATLEALETAARAAGVRPPVWLKVDCGYHRAGVDPEHPESLALALRLAGSRAVTFAGLLTHAGHSYHARGQAQRLAVAAQERDVLVQMAARLQAEGVRVPALSLGSTPSLTAVDHLDGIHEARPGNYAYFDLVQSDLGSCITDDIAVSILATVTSRPAGGDRVVLDAGALALSRDPGSGAWGMGAVCTLDGPGPDPGLVVTAVSQEHGVVRPSDPARLQDLTVGTRVRVLPNHSCLASACFDEVHVVEQGQVTDTWRVHRGR